MVICVGSETICPPCLVVMPEVPVPGLVDHLNILGGEEAGLGHKVRVQVQILGVLDRALSLRQI